MGGHSENDKQLLESGLLADVVVKCGDREWKLHKVILASRSEWFKKALCGHYKEAEDNTVTFSTSSDAHKLDWAIFWIYTRALPEEPFENESELYKACVELYLFADFLLLKDLTQFVRDHLWGKIKDKGYWAQKAFWKCTDVTDQAAPSDLQGVFEGIAFAWDNAGTDWAKESFLSFPAYDHYWIILDKDFRKLAEDNREFYHALLEDLVEVTAQGGYWPYEIPHRCVYGDCEAEWVDHTSQSKTTGKYGDVYWRELGTSDGRGFAKCTECYDRPDEDMVHFGPL